MDESGAFAAGERSGALEERVASLEALALAPFEELAALEALTLVVFEELAPLEVLEGLEVFEGFEGWDALEAGAAAFKVPGALAGLEALLDAAASVFFGGGVWGLGGFGGFGGFEGFEGFGGVAFAFPPSAK